MSVPEAKGKRCLHARFGWILAVSSSPLSSGEMSLFNPCSPSAKIVLPNIKRFRGYEEDFTDPECFFIKRGMLSANPSVTSDFTVFVVVNFALGLWRNGNKSWTRMSLNFGECGSICYYQRKLYAINIYGKIFVWDPYGIDPTKACIIYWKDPSDVFTLRYRMPYLVESSDGKLLVILRNPYMLLTIMQPTQFELMRVDLVKMECEEINGIGKETVFLGDNTTTSVAADDFPGVKLNCIYFTDDCWQRYINEYEENLDEKSGGKDMEIYNVEDGSIERFDVESFSNLCPPLWIFPSF